MGMPVDDLIATRINSRWTRPVISGAAQASPRPGAAPVLQLRDSSGVPYYLKTHYWWAYVHPPGG